VGKIRYHLRFQVIPGKDVKKDAMVLADFCLKHHIEEVVLFLQPRNGTMGCYQRKKKISGLRQ